MKDPSDLGNFNLDFDLRLEQDIGLFGLDFFVELNNLYQNQPKGGTRRNHLEIKTGFGINWGEQANR